MNSLKIVAIIPTWNRVDWFKKSVESVLSQTRKPDLLIVLNNGSTDRTKEYCDSITDESVLVLHNEKNTGASQGMKQLTRRALEEGADWVWFMDDDAIANLDALEKQISTKEFQNPNTMMLTSKIIDAKGEWSSENIPAKFDEKAFEFVGINPELANTGNCIEVNTGGYCGWLVRKECFEEFGFPNDEFFFWFDDIEYVVRVSRTKKVYLNPKSIIQHFATSLVEHKIKWPFSGPIPVIPTKQLGRYFYWNRNYLWFAKQWLPRQKYASFWLKHVARGLVGPVLLKQDHIFDRWKMILTAAKDAAFDKLGKKEGY